MPKQEYIKYLYQKEEYSISEIAEKVGMSWRTAAKYAKKEDWNKASTMVTRRRPVMDPVAEIVDTWLMEDLLIPRKERRTRAAIHRQLREEHGFTGSERSVRRYVSQRKQELQAQSQERYLQLEHPAGRAQADFGTTHMVWNGDLREIKYLTMSFPYSNAGFCVPVPSENTECFIIDDLGFVPLHRDGAELLFNVVARGYERQSFTVTSNLQFSDWNTVLGDNRLTAALIDRLVHHAHILAFEGESYRLRRALSSMVPNHPQAVGAMPGS